MNPTMRLAPTLIRPLLSLLALLAGWFAVSFGSTARALDDFPRPTNSEPGELEPMSAAEALEAIQVPSGMQVSLFASEPDVQNPIAAAVDQRNRVWVAENYTYAEPSQRFDLSLRDRIVILNDTDHDGHADSRVVFHDQLQRLTSVAVGHGGVWAFCPPELLFIPDRNQDDLPDGPPQVVLDGFEVAQNNYHNFANGLKWGPDGWLYGRCGGSCPGNLGLPGTTAEDRIPLRGGIWRYHPIRRTIEVVCTGTTNPWGHDWNGTGELFFINTVNGHLWHGITGAHLTRPHTVDPLPHSYELIDQHADHFHFDTGKGWTQSRDGAANDYGGGHAHSGVWICQNPSWPAELQQRLFTLNFHGRRINRERLDPEGSGYVGRHEDDWMLFGDPWFRGIDLVEDLNDGLLILDWSDTGECHEHTGVHRTSGRIYRVAPKSAGSSSQPATVAEMSLEQLIALHEVTEAQHLRVAVIRSARQRLHELSLTDADLQVATDRLMQIVFSQRPAEVRLNALWTLQLIAPAEDSMLDRLLGDSEPELRQWGLRLLTDTWPIDHVDGTRPNDPKATQRARRWLTLLSEMAANEHSAAVRLALASALQRLPHPMRLPIALPLVQRESDADDHNLPLLVWYGIVPVIDSAPENVSTVAMAVSWPKLLRFTARRYASEPQRFTEPINRLVAWGTLQEEAVKQTLIQGLQDGLAGIRKAPEPQGWSKFAQSVPRDSKLTGSIQQLSVLFGDGRAVDELRAVVADSNLDRDVRSQALESLIDVRDDRLRELCLPLLRTRGLNLTAVRGLSISADPEAARRIIDAFSSFAPEHRSQVITALASHPVWAAALLIAVERERIPPRELTAYHARQIVALQNPELTERLESVWGSVQQSPEEQLAQIAELRTQLSQTPADNVDLSAGRVVFQQVCAACHRLYGEGGQRGPDLTGAQRADLDYLLGNIVTPSAVVPRDFRMSIVQLEDGQVITGVVTNETDQVLTLMTVETDRVISKDEIVERAVSSQSLMPEGLLVPLSKQQIANLFAYLRTDHQVELPRADADVEEPETND